MSIKRKHESRDQRRYTRSSTKKGWIPHRPAHPGRIVAVCLGIVAVIALALIWGAYLKAESDAYRAGIERGEWTLNEQIAIPHPVSVPDIRSISIKPEGNVGDILIAGDHKGVIMTLNDGDGGLLYDSTVGWQAGLRIREDAVSLAHDVERVQKRDLHVTCAFTVTCFSTVDPVTHTYLRGLELALLREFAQAGMDDILLFGLPAGNDQKDQLAIGFLQDLRSLLADLSIPPAIGVALPLDHFATDDSYEPIADLSEDAEAGIPEGTAPLYAGNITPSRILQNCDYLAMDLRDKHMDTVAAILPHVRYTYVRHALRLLVDMNDAETVQILQSHGFERIFEMNAPIQKEIETD